ncbi:MAG: PDDEXK nuclease domain-containing protein [Prevotellaceae bacterium]|nr:PDDEXK nuclease domain-containing protein [Prevotellaceae bacterium]
MMAEQEMIKDMGNLYDSIRMVLQQARSRAAVAVNSAMVEAYWNVGRLIVQAQGGDSKATYGDGLINVISKRLTDELGKGFDASNLRNMRQFYLTFPICDTVCHKLSWSHIRKLMRIENPRARAWYAEEAAKSTWSVRQLERQIATQYYERLLSSHRDESVIVAKASEALPAKPERFDPLTLVHDPFILEFLDAKDTNCLHEAELEQAILTHIEDFLLELGSGFAFVGRQKRFSIDGDHYYPDLVFYNIRARCYVVIDLKMGKVGYEDIGQMQLYVGYYNKEVCTEMDNPTVGIILCTEKNDTMVKFTLGDRMDIGVFASQYKLYIPSEEDFRREIEQTRENFRLMNS